MLMLAVAVGCAQLAPDGQVVVDGATPSDANVALGDGGEAGASDGGSLDAAPELAGDADTPNDGSSSDDASDGVDGGPDEGENTTADASEDADCPPGTAPQAGTCEDIDECFEGTHQCHASSACRNLDPGYTCDCPDGYAGGGEGGAACVPRVTLGWQLCEVNPEGEVYCWDGEGTLQPERVVGLPAAASVEAGEATSCAVLRDGGVSCWGDEAGTEWGTGSDEPVRLGGLRDIVQVSLSLYQSTGCALDRDGAVFCWGDNASGETGSGEATGLPVTRPVRVEGLGPVRRVDVGQSSTGGQVCVALRTGAAYCWGEGLLTGPSTSASSVPVKAASLDDALQVVPAFQRVCARRHTYGSVTCWGTPGLLGVNLEDQGPIQVSDAGPATAISAGLYETCTINEARHLMCWGAGTSPTRVDSPAEYLSLDSGGNRTAALTVDGHLRVWNLSSAGNQLVEEVSFDSLP